MYTSTHVFFFNSYCIISYHNYASIVGGSIVFSTKMCVYYRNVNLCWKEEIGKQAEIFGLPFKCMQMMSIIIFVGGMKYFRRGHIFQTFLFWGVQKFQYNYLNENSGVVTRQTSQQIISYNKLSLIFKWLIVGFWNSVWSITTSARLKSEGKRITQCTN